MLERIRAAVRSQDYDVTKHAVDELVDDELDIIDLETAMLNGSIAKVEKDDPRGTKYTIHGTGADGIVPVGCAGRFTATGKYLIITAYKVTDE